MKHLFFFTVLLFSEISFGQVTDNAVAFTPLDTSSVVIHKDPRLDLLVKTQAQVNEYTSRDARRTVKGFRLMIISTNNREEAIAAKTKVLTYFPELKAYLWYQSPYFRLKAGNFKERKEAEAYQKRLNNYFTNGVFVMQDIIEVKPGKVDEFDILQ